MLAPNPPALKRALRIYFQSARGGPTRLKILLLLADNALNINEMSKRLSMDYKTVQYHIRNLEKSGLVLPSGKSYNNSYEISVILKQDGNFLTELRDMGKSK